MKLADGTVMEVIGRWTKRAKDGKKVPCVTGHIVSFPTGATLAEDGKGKKVDDRQTRSLPRSRTRDKRESRAATEPSV